MTTCIADLQTAQVLHARESAAAALPFDPCINCLKQMLVCWGLELLEVPLSQPELPRCVPSVHKVQGSKPYILKPTKTGKWCVPR